MKQVKDLQSNFDLDKFKTEHIYVGLLGLQMVGHGPRAEAECNAADDAATPVPLAAGGGAGNNMGQKMVTNIRALFFGLAMVDGVFINVKWKLIFGHDLIFNT